MEVEGEKKVLGSNSIESTLPSTTASPETASPSKAPPQGGGDVIIDTAKASDGAEILQDSSETREEETERRKIGKETTIGTSDPEENGEKTTSQEPEDEEEKPSDPVKEKKGGTKKEKKNSSSVPEIKKEEDSQPEVGIVGPPTAVSELVNEAELRTDSDKLQQEHVAEWLKNSVKIDDEVESNIEKVDRKGKGSAQTRTTAGTAAASAAATASRRNGSRRPKKEAPEGAAVSLLPTRKSQRIVCNIIKRSIKCLNKMHAMDGNGSATQVLGNGKKSEDEVSGKPEESSAEGCPKVPQSHQNGAALPEETAAAAAAAAVVSANPPGDRSRTISVVKKELLLESESEKPEAGPTSDSKLPSGGATRLRSEPEIGHGSGRKRKSSSKQASSNGPGTTGGSGIGAGGGGGGGGGGQPSKKACFEDREQFLNSIVGGGACGEKITAEELALKAEQLRAEMEALDELARAKEMEWNEILSMRKLKEEAYLRIERKRQVIGFMEGNNNNNNNSNNNNNNNGNDSLPPATLTLATDWESHTRDKRLKVEEEDNNSVEENLAMMMMMSSATNSSKKERKSASTGSGGSTGATSSKHSGHQQQQQQQRLAATSKQSENGANAGHTGSGGRKQRLENPDNRQIGEGRQGPIVDVRSIIADYRLRHPETVPRRGRRMRNSVNVGLGAGGAMVENTGHNVDSRPSSTDSCKSNPNTADPSNSMSFKDVLVQFAKMSQQQGETVKTPQNYPDVTLHPVSPSPAAQNASVTQQSGSLLHGILTKTQSPRPTTFSPTLARLLTAPERDRNIVPNVTATPQQNAATQHLLQAYQGSNAVSISDLLSSSKARTEITITPVVSNPVSSHSNNLMHADDTEEESAIIEERESRVSGSRDNRDDRDSPPRCQGCHDRAAQFVCAGCGNQWYCSRECQVAAWDEHSEVCSG